MILFLNFVDSGPLTYKESRFLGIQRVVVVVVVSEGRKRRKAHYSVVICCGLYSVTRIKQLIGGFSFWLVCD